MDLADRAIAEYKKEQKLREESNIKAAEIFAEDAIKELQNIIGVERDDITIVDKQLYYASFRVDDILFRVTTCECCYVVNMIQTCPTCGSEFGDRILNIKDIGRMLVEPHYKYDCEHALEMKKRMEKLKRENDRGGILSTDEKLLTVLKEFVSENGC